MRNVLKMLGVVLVASIVGCNVETTDVEAEDMAAGDVDDLDAIGEAESALPGEEREIEYYSDASMDQMVGFRVQSCWGTSMWGHTSPYWMAWRGASCTSPWELTNPGMGCHNYTMTCSAEYQYCINCF